MQKAISQKEAMLMIRLSRVGKIKQPTYRLIVSEKSKDTRGKYLEILGTYNPRSNPATVKFDAERIKYWMSKGAQPSDTVHNLLVDQKIVDAQKRKIWAVPKAKEDTKPAEASK